MDFLNHLKKLFNSKSLQSVTQNIGKTAFNSFVPPQLRVPYQTVSAAQKFIQSRQANRLPSQSRPINLISKQPNFNFPGLKKTLSLNRIPDFKLNNLVPNGQYLPEITLGDIGQRLQKGYQNANAYQKRYMDVSRRDIDFRKGRGQALSPEDKQFLSDYTGELAGGIFNPFNAGKKKIAQQVVESAKPRLKSLLTYSDDLGRLGFTRQQIDKIGINQGRKILEEKLPQYYNKQAVDVARTTEYLSEEASRGLRGGFNRAFQPIKNLTPDIREAVINHDRALKVARVDANNLAMKFKSGLAPELEWRLLKFSQKPTADTARRLNLDSVTLTKAQDLIEQSRTYNDQLFARAKAAGVELNYLRNHVYQAFKEAPEQIDEIFKAKGLGSKPGWANHRTIENFEKGIELGLTPKFTSFGQLNAAAEEAFQRAMANKELVDKLKKSGQILPDSQAPAYWDLISARFFPKESIRYGTELVREESYKAPPQLAKFLNSYLGGQTKQTGDLILGGTAQLSRTMQDVVLSGGVGPLNFFGLGQLIKEGTAGRIITPLRAFFRAYVPGASHAYEQANYQFIREMASQGIKARGVTNYKELYKNVAENPKIREVLGKTWYKTINEPTFGKFLNQLQIGFYKDMRTHLIKAGLREEQAIRTAAEATKKFYGLTENLGRSEGVDDLLTTVFLAPKYRESMLNIFINMSRAFNPKTAGFAENRGLQRLAVGMGLTFGLYNVAQKRLTGGFMWDNPPGKEFELVIPVGDPKDEKFLSFPWMPGFTAVPRRIMGTIFAAAKGDLKESVGQAGGLASIPLSKMFELVRNKDYFGNEIIGEENPLLDTGLFVGKSFLPGYGRAVVDVASGKSTPAFGAIQALELPIRKGSLNAYYRNKEEALKGLSQEEKQQAEFLLTSNSKGGPDSEAEAKMMIENPKLLEVRRKLALAENPNDPLYSRSETDIKAFLAYRVLEDTQQRAHLRAMFPWIPSVQLALSREFERDIDRQNTPTAGFRPDSVQGRLGSLFNPPKEPTITPKDLTRRSPTPLQQLTPDQVRIASAYTALPKGSAARKQLLAQNPWLKLYWQANEEYYAQNPYQVGGQLGEFLSSLGITSLPETASSFTPYARRPKKVRVGRVKKVKLASKKIDLEQPELVDPKTILKRKTLKKSKAYS